MVGCRPAWHRGPVIIGASFTAESLDLFRALRAGTLGLLRRVDGPLLEHHGVHGERGRETVTHILRMYAGHDRNHARQIERLLAAR